ncbi:ABC transporter ATP-binding protein [Holzapfeliella floricola]|uniref:ABC transporter ATPase component n=1 Tax=Holzapfeliella floricola DSM 23037 = JCM 16512 TaxID=1423744 RepID=A0A0R2DVH3_9LACO|nr:ABC transporter ATP-binding protein [Holzapfeliella floricola]KRN04604.1 ABC transporter ATPase component [Holzapfeliella floricola DSM 23037 = JCM 16512]
MTNNQIVKVQNINKIYGKRNEKKYQALKDIDFSVQKGEFIGIMGASGSGKTTLLNMLSTLDKPTSGHIYINEQDITQLKKNQMADFRGREIGFIFQDFNLLENLSCRENIALPLSLQNVSSKEIKPKVQKIATKLGISQILDKYPSEISGGQKQRVAASRALVHEPSILFGDEPTGALDSKSAKELLNTMQQLNEEDAVSILMVTHDAAAASYAQRILFIKDGEIHRELKRGQNSRSDFYQEIIQTLGTYEQ